MREIERVAVIEAVGRILGKDVSALIDLPPFDNSALDGYAVRISDFTEAGPWDLSVGGTIAAGDVYAGEAVHPQEALRIFTGAPVGTC